MQRIGISFILGLIVSGFLISGCASNQQQASSQLLTPPNGSNPTQAASAKSTSQDDTTNLATVKSLRANLQEHPDKASAVIKEVRKGEGLRLVNQTPVGPWYRVRHGKTGEEGWIHGSGINIADNEPVTETRKTQPQREGDEGGPSTGKGGAASGRYYKNVDGEMVPSPVFSNTAPQGATARCRDGSYSFSRHRSGTCSHHGGVDEWLLELAK